MFDRQKDMINRGGLKIYSAEVESVLAGHPAVVESAIIAKPCPVIGERVHAVIVTRAEVNAESLRAWCAERLSDYKVPETVALKAEPLPRNAVTDGNIENMDQVVEAVRRVWKKSGTRAKHVALGMPPASVITKKIILPAGLPEDQLEVQVESEASQYIPFALDEVSLDFDVIGPAANSADDIEVMLTASRREKVEDRVAIAEASGLKASVMDIESYAARAALQVLGVRSAAELAQIIVSVGLAQNLAALRALATEGIQRGHMGLHARQVAIAAGARADQVEAVANQLVRERAVRTDRALEILQAG